MQLENLHQATQFVVAELQRRGYEIRSGVWVNEGRNALYTTITPNGDDETFFLKYDKKAFFTAGREVNIGEQLGVAINWDAYSTFIQVSQPTILYALPEGVYHTDFMAFHSRGIGPHTQKFNKEVVIIAPFSIFKTWRK